MEEIEKKRKLTPQKIGVIILVIISVNLGQRYIFNKPSAEKQIAELVAKSNKSLPQMLTSEIRMDSMNSFSNTVQYNLTIVNIEKENINVEELKQNLKQSVLTDLKSKPGLEAFKENNITMAYSYNDKNKNNLCKISFTANQYK
jgi:hypothetical protein